MLPLLHLLCLTLGVLWGEKRFTCRVLIYLELPPDGSFSGSELSDVLLVGPGLSPAPTRGVASSKVLVPEQLCCVNLASLRPEALSCHPLLGRSMHQLPYGRKDALKWCAHLRACVSGSLATAGGLVLVTLVRLILLQLRPLSLR